jgi:hypothetical protein
VIRIKVAMNEKAELLLKEPLALNKLPVRRTLREQLGQKIPEAPSSHSNSQDIYRSIGT